MRNLSPEDDEAMLSNYSTTTSMKPKVPAKCYENQRNGVSSTNRPSSLKILSEEFMGPRRWKKSTWQVFSRYQKQQTRSSHRQTIVIIADKLLSREKFLYSCRNGGKKSSQTVWMRCTSHGRSAKSALTQVRRK